jgi:hypothetical protein
MSMCRARLDGQPLTWTLQECSQPAQSCMKSENTSKRRAGVNGQQLQLRHEQQRSLATCSSPPSCGNPHLEEHNRQSRSCLYSDFMAQGLAWGRRPKGCWEHGGKQAGAGLKPWLADQMASGGQPKSCKPSSSAHKAQGGELRPERRSKAHGFVCGRVKFNASTSRALRRMSCRAATTTATSITSGCQSGCWAARSSRWARTHGAGLRLRLAFALLAAGLSGSGWWLPLPLPVCQAQLQSCPCLPSPATVTVNSRAVLMCDSATQARPN